MIEKKTVECDDEGVTSIIPASDEAATAVLMAPQTEEGRSNFVWVILCNGDIALASFPQGEHMTQLALRDIARRS